MVETTLGERIAEAREMAGRTQKQWAWEVAESRRTATANDWERNRAVPDVPTILRMVEASGIDAHYLLTGEPPKVRATKERNVHAEAEAFGQIAAIVLRVVGTVEGANSSINQLGVEHTKRIAPSNEEASTPPDRTGPRG